MEKLSKNMASKRYLEKKHGKIQPLPEQMKKQLEQAGEDANAKIRLNNAIYNQSNAHSHETIVQEKTPAERFVDNIDKMRNPHIRDCVSAAEKFGSIEDYSEYQEQKDLERYKSFINSSAYDFIRDTEDEVNKQLTLIKLRQISSYYED